MMQGPRAKTSRRFDIGEEIVVRFRGEDEFFPLRIKALYPDANAMLLGENLIKLSDLAEIRLENRKGLKDYLRIQGLVNIVTVGLVALADRESRERQAGFMLGAAGVGGAMMLYGSTGRYRTRLLGNGRPYFLVILGEVKPLDRTQRP